MPLSEVDICNATLGALGIDVAITALTDTSREGVQCNRFYSIARDELLEIFPWNAVKKRSSPVRDGGTFDVSGQATAPQAVIFRTNGKIMYVLSGTSVYTYALSRAWDPTSASHDSKTFDFSTEEATPTGIAFKSNGLKMYMVGSTDDIVEQYTLTEAWDPSTATVDAVQLDVSTQGNSPQGITFGNSGVELYVVDDENNAIDQYTLSTAYDLSTATYTDTISVAVQETNPSAVAFSTTGLKMYVAGYKTDAVHQYTLSTAWDITTATTDSVDFQREADDNVITGLFFNTDGTQMYLIGTENDKVLHYGLEVGWDLSTANGDAPVEDYDYSYVLPADCLRLLEVRAYAKADEPQYEVEGRRLLIDEKKHIHIKYIKKETDTDMFPPLFAKALIYNLGVYLAMSLTNDSRLQDAMEVRRNAYMSEAEKMTAREGNPDERPPRTGWQRRGRRASYDQDYPEVIN